VVALDARTNRVIVGPRSSGSTEIRLRQVNWLLGSAPENLTCAVKLRARDQLRPARVRTGAGGTVVSLEVPALAAPGQACVFYDGTRILGGGVICGA